MSNITDVQNVSVPLNGTVPDGVPQFRIRSTVDLSETEVAVIGHSAGPIYLSMAVMMPPGLPDGSYEYDLSVNGTTVSQGCLQIGEYRPEGKEYEKEITYRQYGG